MRERGEDILLLAEHFLTKYNRKYHKEAKGLTREAKNKLLKYNWPGNVRELQHTLERAVILSENNLLRPNDVILSENNLLRPNDFFFPHTTAGNDNENIPELNLEKLERKAIEQALKASGGNMSRAAELLGITRFTLYRKLEKLGL